MKNTRGNPQIPQENLRSLGILAKPREKPQQSSENPQKSSEKPQTEDCGESVTSLTPEDTSYAKALPGRSRAGLILVNAL